MKILMLILTMFIVGCSQGPDFTKPVKVIEKSSWVGGSSYTLEPTSGVRSEGSGSVMFYAPTDFANAGDTIVFKDGVIKVIPIKQD